MVFWLVLVAFILTFVINIFLKEGVRAAIGWASLMACAVALLLFIMSIGLVYGAGKQTDSAGATVKSSREQEIVALADNAGVSGTFFLGSGTVDGDMFYSYMVEQDGYKTIKTIPASGVMIDDSGLVEPCIEYQTLEPSDAEQTAFWWAWTPSFKRIIIHIPPNSITNTYNIDLK